MDEAAARARLTQLWVDHSTDVRRFLARRLAGSSSAPDADDLLSDTYTVVWRRIHDVPAHERAWIFQIARNLLMTHLRDEGRRHTLLERLGHEHVPPQSDPEHVALSRASLQGAWSALGAGDREVISLIVWDGLDHREAARVLDCNTATFTVRLHRARRRLLRLLTFAEDQPAGKLEVRAGTQPGSLT